MDRPSDQIRDLEVVSEKRVWRLRPLYIGGTGIVAGRIVDWSGSSELTIGRYEGPNSASRCMSVDDGRVSRRHARLFCAGGKTFIEDLRSRNGTALNGEVLRPGEPRPVGSGDIIRVGQSFLLIRHEPLTEMDGAVPALVGWSRAAGQLRRTILMAASHTRPVLLLGEYGTGKSLVADEIHRRSARGGPLVTVDCETLTVAAIHELFPRAPQGSAAEPGEGVIDMASASQQRKTLVFDEAGSLSLDAQSALLSVLTGGDLSSSGERRRRRRDVRIIVASGKHLLKGAAESGFLACLHERIEATVVLLPPLRERREDILLLAQYFAGPGFRPSPRLVSRLLAHSWPRNVPELAQVVTRVESGNEEDVYASLTAQMNPLHETLLD
jgi:pSer/pThr/pTyr-binding forkhead associated (FHA) protein